MDLLLLEHGTVVADGANPNYTFYQMSDGNTDIQTSDFTNSGSFNLHGASDAKFGADAFPGAANVIGRIEDDIYGNRGAEQALVREMIGQDINGLPAEEIRRRADLQLGREFYQPDGGTGAEGKQYKRRPNVAAMPIDAYAVREQQILSDLGRIKQNAEAVEANNWRAQAAANIIGQDFQIGGRGARADQAIENIGHIAKIGHAKIGNDFQVEPTRVTDDLNAPVTDNRFAGPLQKQEQFIVDNMPGYREAGAFGDFPKCWN